MWGEPSRQEWSNGKRAAGGLEHAATVFVIDPQGSFVAAVQELAAALEFQCRSLTSGHAFFAECAPRGPACLVLDSQIPDLSGLQIQRRLRNLETGLPLVFVSGCMDTSLAVELMRGGAIHYLLKPPRPLDLSHAIQEALARHNRFLKERRRAETVAQQIALLTLRERDVLRLIGEGRTNDAIAHKLRVSRRTVELRRGQLMKKLELRAPTQLLWFAVAARRYATKHLRGASPAIHRSYEEVGLAKILDDLHTPEGV